MRIMKVSESSRKLGQTDLRVSSVAMGAWPISGMTSLEVNDADSLATLRAAFDSGINFFDSAYCYGANGESDRLIARAFESCRDEIVIATKCGLHWGADGKMAHDASAAAIRRECDESLLRLGTDRVELLYLHAPDPKVPIEESAGALKALLDDGKARSIGASNFSVTQLAAFHAICPISAVQPPYNLIMRGIEKDVLPWCVERGISVCPYWPLMKGLLAGKLARDHVFDPKDGRTKYPMFQGEEWLKNQDLVDDLREIAADVGRTVSQLAINWTISQPGITSALCGAKRASQIEDSAGAMGWELTAEQRARVEAALARRGEPVSRAAV